MLTSEANELREKVKFLTKTHGNKLRITFKGGRKEDWRIFVSDGGSICKFKKGSSRSGYPFPIEEIESVDPIPSRKSPEQKWETGWTKVKSRLVDSGLWENLIDEIDTAMAMGYDRIQSASKEYWDIPYDDNRSAKQKEFLEKYPELDNDGNINTNVLFHYSEAPRVKKMRFSKWDNENILAGIQVAMAEGKKCRKSGIYGYDVSFEYNPELKRAWYSEEYRGCGNGHYYLALDATHALYYEKD